MSEKNTNTHQSFNPYEHGYSKLWRYVVVIVIYFFFLTGVIGDAVRVTTDAFAKDNPKLIQHLSNDQYNMEVSIVNLNAMSIVKNTKENQDRLTYRANFLEIIYETEDYLIVVSSYNIGGPLTSGADASYLLKDEQTGKYQLKDEIAQKMFNNEIKNYENKDEFLFLVDADDKPDILLSFDNAKSAVNKPYYTSLYNGIRQFLVYLILAIPLILLALPDYREDIDLLKKQAVPVSINQTLTTWIYIMAASLLAGVITIIIRSLGFSSPSSSINQISINLIQESNGYIFMLLSAVVFGPIVEELVFRKAVFKLIPNNIAAIIVSSLVFGLIHIDSELLTGNIPLILSVGSSYILAGVAFGLAYVKFNKNLYIVTFAHMLYNLLSMVLVVMIF